MQVSTFEARTDKSPIFVTTASSSTRTPRTDHIMPYKYSRQSLSDVTFITYPLTPIVLTCLSNLLSLLITEPKSSHLFDISNGPPTPYRAQHCSPVRHTSATYRDIISLAASLL